MPGFTLKEASSRAEVDSIVDVIWRVRFQPYAPSSSMSFPIFGYTSADHERCLNEAKERVWAQFTKQQPAASDAAMAHGTRPVDDGATVTTSPPPSDSQRWIYVVDDRSGLMVGCTRFDYLAGSPFPNGVPNVDFTFWPEGEAKLCGQEITAQIQTPRSIWMQRPHGGFGITATLPEYRSRGVGTIMLNWVTDRLDDMGIEGFVEASDIGRPLYEKGGFITVMKLTFFIPTGKPEEWQKWAHELMPPPWNAMWRPVNGKIEEGGRNRPWQLGPSLPA